MILSLTFNIVLYSVYLTGAAIRLMQEFTSFSFRDQTDFNNEKVFLVLINYLIITLDIT